MPIATTIAPSSAMVVITSTAKAAVRRRAMVLVAESADLADNVIIGAAGINIGAQN